MNLLKSSITAFLFGGVILVNYLANALPINDQNTGEISDAYENLFAPPGIIFSIWGLIYILLLVFAVYQFGIFERDGSARKTKLLGKMFPYVAVNFVANIVWIFLWHYDFILLALLVMLVILFTLIKIADIHRGESFSLLEKISIKLPFSIYFGWISVATLANGAVFLVATGWTGFSAVESLWTSGFILLGALIGIGRMTKDADIVYGLVFVWAYGGILGKHISSGGFSGEYVDVIIATVLSLVLFGIFGARLALRRKE
jgi:hypothetical protein